VSNGAVIQYIGNKRRDMEQAVLASMGHFEKLPKGLFKPGYTEKMSEYERALEQALEGLPLKRGPGRPPLRDRLASIAPQGGVKRNRGAPSAALCNAKSCAFLAADTSACMV
jgi:hypothetical protein